MKPRMAWTIAKAIELCECRADTWTEADVCKAVFWDVLEAVTTRIQVHTLAWRSFDSASCKKVRPMKFRWLEAAACLRDGTVKP